jgi:beta-N-acetylhexosaminidase
MPEENEKEKLEYLRREEIRTMEKDIKKLREIEAERERMRISALEAEAKKTKVMPHPKEEMPRKETILPKPPQKPPLTKKILVRIGISLILIFLIGFLYWLLAEKPKVKPAVEKPPEEKIIEKPEIRIPPSFISIEKTFSPEISKNEEILEVFNQMMKEELSEGKFGQIAIKNTTENRLVSLEEISQIYQIDVPEGFFQKLEENFTLALFSQKEGKRIVFLAKVKEETGLKELLKNWEEKISKEGIFISGKKITTLSPYFRTSFYQNVDFRYLTISKEDLGICYAFFDDYFVFTSSFESMKKVIEELKSKISLENKMGQLFIVGFEGKTLTPQLEEFFKKYKPGGLLLLSKNIESKEQLKNLISDLQNLSLKETGLPLFIAVDQEGEPLLRIGFLEEKTGQSEIKDSQEAYQIGKKRGEELKELGINLNLAPLLDDMKSGDFYFNRTFQKSPELIGELAKSLILGQKAAGILTAIKHFPGYVGISFNPENKLAEISLPEISQFKKAMEAKPDLVMASNVIYKEIDPSLPFTFSSRGVQFLKSNLGEEVLIISDDLSQNSLLRNFSLKEIVTKPLEAGVDILIFSGYRLSVEQGLDTFFAAIKNKEVSEERINEAISRITQLKEEALLK